jgi:hypothetical protein
VLLRHPIPHCWFRTPEAWDITGSYRASMYMRPAAIWAMEMTRPDDSEMHVNLSGRPAAHHREDPVRASPR